MGRLRNPICRGYYPATRRNLKEYGWYEHNQLHSYKNAFWLLKSINGDIFPLAEFKEHKIKFDYANLQFIKSTHLICVSVSSWGGGGEDEKKRWINSGQVEHKEKKNWSFIIHWKAAGKVGTATLRRYQWHSDDSKLLPFKFPENSSFHCKTWLTWRDSWPETYWLN